MLTRLLKQIIANRDTEGKETDVCLSSWEGKGRTPLEEVVEVIDLPSERTNMKQKPPADRLPDPVKEQLNSFV
jgi:hypothetical protein